MKKILLSPWMAILTLLVVLTVRYVDPDNKPVLQPVTVEQKPKCQTCGKLNKATSKFCTECGTSLTVFA